MAVQFEEPIPLKRSLMNLKSTHFHRHVLTQHTVNSEFLQQHFHLMPHSFKQIPRRRWAALTVSKHSSPVDYGRNHVGSHCLLVSPCILGLLSGLNEHPNKVHDDCPLHVAGQSQRKPQAATSWHSVWDPKRQQHILGKVKGLICSSC